MKKRLVVLGVAAVMTLTMSITAFASQSQQGGFRCNGYGRGINRENRITSQAGNGFRRGAGNFDCAGLGQGGAGRALGPGGMMLRDGSCFVSSQN